MLLKDGVGLLTDGGGPSDGVSGRGAGDVAGACRLTERWPVVSWPWFSRGVWLVGQLLLRPIVSAIGSPTYNLAKFVTSIISPLAGTTSPSSRTLLK